MFDYYDEKLSAERLRRVYEVAPPRLKQYLDAEIQHVLGRMKPGAVVLELGCGYGRVLERLAPKAGHLYGIDTSLASLKLAHQSLSAHKNIFLARMNAANLAFSDRCFDLVVCIQNGISAFHVDQRQLIAESLRVTKPGGLILFSSYSERFWDERLHWFELQAQHGLLGEIDREKSGNGIIVCKDGFTATTFDEAGFRLLTHGLNADVHLLEVDLSSLFCEIYL
jgi:ubiquinone/menaquinone biosynthesis C-methylase UbiE